MRYKLGLQFILLAAIIVLISTVNGSGLCLDKQVTCAQIVKNYGCNGDVGRHCSLSCGLCVTTPSITPVTLPTSTRPPADCSEAYSRGWTKDGQQSVSILPGATQIVEVWCQKGWTLAQRRVVGSDVFLHHKSKLENYENGLGDVSSDHWIGLRHQHSMTSLRPHRMRLEMLWDDRYGDKELKWIECQSFGVGPKSSGWKLSVAKCVTNLPLNPLLLYQNGAQFTNRRWWNPANDSPIKGDVVRPVLYMTYIPSTRPPVTPATLTPTVTITPTVPRPWTTGSVSTRVPRTSSGVDVAWGYWWNSAKQGNYASINDRTSSSSTAICMHNNHICSYFYRYIKSSQMMLRPISS